MNETAAIINKYKVRANKSLSQNFLIDEFVIGKIADAAGLDEGVSVIEIGAGAGSLTKELLKRAGSVIAIELDGSLCEILAEEYGENQKLTIINDDIMKLDVNGVAARESEKGKLVKVCANLPYHLTSPIIMRLLEGTSNIESLTLMMQKEVADRVLSRPGTKSYGALTVSINYYARTRLIANVPPNCFIPRPGVHSAVVSFEILKEKDVVPKDEALMFSVIKAAFGQRRKTLYNALANQLIKGIGMSREELSECFQELSGTGIQSTVRGERLSLEEFSLLSDILSSCRQ